jgi:hypothetical protein
MLGPLFTHTPNAAGVFVGLRAATVSENSERAVKNSGELGKIILDAQREKPTFSS